MHNWEEKLYNFDICVNKFALISAYCWLRVVLLTSMGNLDCNDRAATLWWITSWDLNCHCLQAFLCHSKLGIVRNMRTIFTKKMRPKFSGESGQLYSTDFMETKDFHLVILFFWDENENEFCPNVTKFMNDGRKYIQNFWQLTFDLSFVKKMLENRTNLEALNITWKSKINYIQNYNAFFDPTDFSYPSYSLGLYNSGFQTRGTVCDRSWYIYSLNKNSIDLPTKQ